MSFKLLIVAVAQLAMFHLAQSQCINRIIAGPNCGPNILPIAETILPNQYLYPPNYIGSNIIDYPFEILPNGQILPGLPGSILPTVLPGQVLPSVLPGPVLPSVLPGQVLPSVLPGQVLPNVLPSPVLPATTIIQDSTVANNLANALQLLVVSNLLANTLPQNEVILPAPMPCGLGGYSYIY